MKIFFPCFYFSFLILAIQIQLSVTSSCTKDIKSYVDGHNSKRLQVASGKTKRQPSAAKMNMVVWDQELERKAIGWAAQHIFVHNANKTVPSQRFITGENLYLHATTNPNYKLKPEVGMNAWFNEHLDFKYGAQEVKAGYYTQMVWSDSIYIGCAISKYFEDGWHKFLLVCYYGPTGNYVGEVPYKKGGPIQNLTCGCGPNDLNCDCTKPYGGQCNLIDINIDI